MQQENDTIDESSNELNSELESKPPKRLNILILLSVPTYIFVYSIASIWLLIDGWVNNFSSLYHLWGVDNLPSKVIFLIFTAIGAILGSAILGICSFHRYQAIEKSFDIDHLWGFLFSPLLATIIGILVFSIIQSGLIVLSGSIDGNHNPANATLGYLAIGAVTGYNWDVFIKKLQELSKSVLNVGG